jgi:hypothetical protein
MKEASVIAELLENIAYNMTGADRSPRQGFRTRQILGGFSELVKFNLLVFSVM